MKLLLTLIALIPFLALSQSDKKLMKILGEGYVQKEAQSSYSIIPSGDINFNLSLSELNDTTDADNGVEYVMYKDSMVFYNNEVYKLLREEYVTNYEYDQFINWVIDSLIRERIYSNSNPSGSDEIPEELIGKMLIHPKIYYDEVNQEWMEFDPSQPFINRELFHFDYDFDWEKEIRYYRYWPLILEMYLPPHERLSKRKLMDERKWNFRFPGDKTKDYSGHYGLQSSIINISRDHEAWSKSSEHRFDIPYNLSRFYGKWSAFSWLPVVGINGAQARAYLFYLERKYQTEIDKKKLPYRIKISLPTEEDIKGHECDCEDGIPGIFSEEKDMSEQWKISNQEYQEFVLWVEDSIIRETLYENALRKLELEDAAMLLDYNDIYFSESAYEWKEFDPADTYRNRNYHNLNWKFDWKKKLDPKAVDSTIYFLFDDGEFIKRKYIYRYYWTDHKRMSHTDNLKWEEAKSEHEKKVGWFLCTDPVKGCKNLDLGNSVRRYEDYSKFMVREGVSVYPGIDCREHNLICYLENYGSDYHFAEDEKTDCPNCPDIDKTEFDSYDFTSNPEAPILNITYAQALAYYHWKYQRSSVYSNSNSVIFDDLVPTEEQFKMVQAGEKMIVPKTQHNYPTPVFRYVVHVFEK